MDVAGSNCSANESIQVVGRNWKFLGILRSSFQFLKMDFYQGFELFDIRTFPTGFEIDVICIVGFPNVFQHGRF